MYVGVRSETRQIKGVYPAQEHIATDDDEMLIFGYSYCTACFFIQLKSSLVCNWRERED